MGRGYSKLMRMGRVEEFAVEDVDELKLGRAADSADPDASAALAQMEFRMSI